MIKVDAKTREAAITLFSAECTKMERVISRIRIPNELDLKRCVELADSEVYVKFGFHIKDLFV